MACAASGAGNSLVHRTGVCVQRVQNPADAAAGNYKVIAGRLDAAATGVDFLACDCDAGPLGGHVREMARGSGSAKSDVRISRVFYFGILHFVFRSDVASTLDYLSRL